MSYLSAIFSTPVLTNIMLGCFVAAAACVAIHYHRQIRELQKQGEEMISTLRRIVANTQKP